MAVSEEINRISQSQQLTVKTFHLVLCIVGGSGYCYVPLHEAPWMMSGPVSSLVAMCNQARGGVKA